MPRKGWSVWGVSWTRLVRGTTMHTVVASARDAVAASYSGRRFGSERECSMDVSGRAESEAMRARVAELLASVVGRVVSLQTPDTLRAAGDVAIDVARLLLRMARIEETRAEWRLERRLMRLMGDEAGRRLTLAFTDQALRPNRPERVAEQLRYLLKREGIPNYFSRWERLQLSAFKAMGSMAPGWVVPKVIDKLEDEVARVTLPAQEPALSRAIAAARGRGARVNLNHLGEAILGDEEAKRRHAGYLQTLGREDLAAVSVKVSSVVSQIDMLGWDRTLAVMSERIGVLYAAAGDKLVTLDMEEYRDLELTFELLSRLVMKPEFLGVRAGVVLQAYLPDGMEFLERLLVLARRRVEAGGTRLRLRLVKGANLAMERVDASLHGFWQAPYTSKADVDANFKRMMLRALEPEHARFLDVGIGSHNLFDLALGMVVRAANGVEKTVGFEMLEGIAPALQRVVIAVTGDLLVYTPTVASDDLLAAIAYLIRRLDENTGRDNFLRESFGMVVDSDAFGREAERFRRAVVEVGRPFVGSRRRASGIGVRPGGARRTTLSAEFRNEPDTDWTLPENRVWIAGEIDALKARLEVGPVVVTAGAMSAADAGVGAREVVRREDPSRPGVVVASVEQVALTEIAGVVQGARAAMSDWSARTVEARADVLLEVARGLRKHRGELIALMMAEAGKAVPEGDAEVSEAVDFAEYYARSAIATAAEVCAKRDERSVEVTLKPRGVVLVTPPWNFPLAIAAGGVLAALVAGNAVVFKPAPETCATARRLAELCWAAGVPSDVLQFVPCANDPVGTALMTHPGVDAVVLTGGTRTARRFLELRPELFLMAETGGKNAMIVTEMADRDLAIKHALQGAFGHAGQKCSATSLLILEAPLYDDLDFLERLRDATTSLWCGSSWELGNRVTPLIREPTGDLLWALTGLDEGERWLVEPKRDAGNPRLWSPGVKLGVKPGSRTHLNELFGPVLAVMRAEDLDDAIRIANAVPFGLTAGIQTLDDRESRKWSETIDAGCLYVNRATTGAIVQRQPFGGRKASVFGPGAKAGGPNYVLQMAHVDEAVRERDDYAEAFERHFKDALDPSRLIGQDNVLRYRPTSLHLRLGAGATLLEAERMVKACRVAGVTRLTASAATELMWVDRLGVVVEVVAAGEWAVRNAASAIRRVRAIGGVEPEVRAACHGMAVHYEAAAVSAIGRVELLRVLEEQTLSVDYHRFGNLGARESEDRSAAPDSAQ